MNIFSSAGVNEKHNDRVAPKTPNAITYAQTIVEFLVFSESWRKAPFSWQTDLVVTISSDEQGGQLAETGK